jgi:hypothetical protein
MMPDPSKRFSPTPLEASLSLQGTKLLLATNHQGLRDQLQTRFPANEHCGSDVPIFSLKIVVEENSEFSTLPEVMFVHEFDLDGLGYSMIGQKSFLAYDREKWQGFSFLTSRLVDDEKQFNRYFLRTLRSILKRITQ